MLTITVSVPGLKIHEKYVLEALKKDYGKLKSSNIQFRIKVRSQFDDNQILVTLVSVDSTPKQHTFLTDWFKSRYVGMPWSTMSDLVKITENTDLIYKLHEVSKERETGFNWKEG